jgi:regulator of sigma E protease
MILTIVAFVFVLGIVVLVHELGHFWVAKLNGIYVVTFSFGLGPKVIKKKIGDTEYAISAIPFGGYVKFAGESFEDETGDGEDRNDEPGIPEDRLYRSKNPLQKMSVVAAGPVMNAISAVVLYILIAWVQGLYVVPGTVVKEVERDTPAARAGFLPDDRILSVNGSPFRFWSDLETHVTFEEGVSSSFTVLRGADTLIINVTPEFNTETGYWRIGIDAPLPARVGNVKRDSPAEKAGIRPNSVILAINDTTITYWRQLEEKIHARPGVEMEFTWEHDGRRYTAMITPAGVDAPAEGERVDVVTIGGIGIGPAYERISISFEEAIGHGLRSCYRILVGILGFLAKLVTGNAAMRAVGGPIKVGIMAGDMLRWGFSYLVYFIAFFSLNLTIFNLLPILPFDGGHFVIHLTEFVSRRRINQRVHAVMVQIGYVILIALIVFIFLNDILNLFR